MTQKKSGVQWWKLSEGKFVGREKDLPLDTPTQALIRGLIEFEHHSKTFYKKSVNDIAALKIVETPLPFEPISEWMTWTVRGTEVSH